MNDLLKITLRSLAVVVFLSGCTVQLVSKYDDQTDTNVTALQKKFDSYFVNLKSESYPNCSYFNNMSFYKDADVEISGILVRAKAIPKNDITVNQLDAINTAISDLEKLHKLKDKQNVCIDPTSIDTDRILFNTIFTAILKLEIAKKRGESK
ncbi:hypothetical protein [Geomesophilobacter sediminis]|uniref:Lipoprotein n=1 Tax=Geomesophilobacter sediminis TaxID=2798584 RepID=A0A8J7M226_9BACT|nr:hypothetical protein [Geomesophilobacter sediminis]MBJ6727202.1 hypothetical protein [Geomesophilobacter sediminis]